MTAFPNQFGDTMPLGVQLAVAHDAGTKVAEIDASEYLVSQRRSLLPLRATLLFQPGPSPFFGNDSDRVKADLAKLRVDDAAATTKAAKLLFVTSGTLSRGTKLF